MAAVVNVNGRITDETHAVISVFDHAFLYGEGVYETLRTTAAVPMLSIGICGGCATRRG